MYQEHCVSGTQKFARESSEHLKLVILMVSLSIQQNWKSIGSQLLHVKKHGVDSHYLFGFKKDTYAYVDEHKDKLYEQYIAVVDSDKTDKVKALELLKIFYEVPGLNLIKAGFVCQLVAGLVGCIDSNNEQVKEYRIKPNDIKLAKSVKSEKIRNKKMLKYISICHNIGTEKLWNNWCTLVYKKRKWENSFTVSKVHIDYLESVNG
jgi:hypothetical protein